MSFLMWNKFVKPVTEPKHSPAPGGHDYCSGPHSHSSRTVVVGLGNDLLTDDGIGLFLARRLRHLLDPERYDIFELSVGGIEIVEHLTGYERAVVIDACRTGRHAPGTLTRHRPDDFANTVRLGSYHTMNFATTLELARLLGADLPRQIDIFAVEVEDTETVSEGCTPNVEARIAALADEIAQTLMDEEEKQPSEALPISVAAQE